MKNKLLAGRKARRSKSNRGAALVIITVFIVALFGFASLSLDVGAVQLQRKRAQEGIDAAALASVKDWASGKTDSEVIQIATDFANTNGVKNTELISIEPGIWVDATKTFTAISPLPANSVPAVRIVARRTVPTPFWKVVSFGSFSDMKPRVEAVAIVGQALAASGVLPWAMCDTFVATKCSPITLQFKQGGETNACSGSGPVSGNFGQITLPGNTGNKNGADWYRDNIQNGYYGTLRVGQCLQTDPGVSWGPTFQGINDRLQGLPAYTCTSTSTAPENNRLALVPKFSSISEVNGKTQICINGFYVIILDGYDNSSKTVNARFFEAYGGTEVNPAGPPVPGELAGVALVR